MTIAASGLAPAQEPIDAPFDQYQRYGQALLVRQRRHRDHGVRIVDDAAVVAG